MFVKELNEGDAHEMTCLRQRNLPFPWRDGQSLPCKNIHVDKSTRVLETSQKLLAWERIDCLRFS